MLFAHLCLMKKVIELCERVCCAVRNIGQKLGSLTFGSCHAQVNDLILLLGLLFEVLYRGKVRYTMHQIQV